jgi:phenylacetate-CoA ligase
MPRSSASSQPSRADALDQIREGQLRRLRQRLPEVLHSNSFYRERLHDVRGWDDFERLPLLTKEELNADQAAWPPFGTNLTYPLDRYTRLHQTSGTGGSRPLRWLDTEESWSWWESIWAGYVYRAAEVVARDRVFMAFSFGPFIGFWSAFAGAERLGCLCISGGAMNSEQRVRAIMDLAPTVLCCTPTYALRLAETALEIGVDLAASAIKMTIHAGEPGASIPATKATIERAYGARCYDHTGMTELGPTGYTCWAGGGVHLIEEEFIFEVVDDELVATNLGRWGSPVIRYRTGDRVELSREPCECGSPFAKLVHGIRGRVDDMFTVRGVNLYPSQVEDIVRRHPEVVEYVIEHRRLREMDEVTLLLEIADGRAAAPEVIAAELRQALGARIDCRAVPPGTLPRAELKAKRLLRVDD